MEILLDRIKELVVPLLEQEGKVLVDFNYFRGRRKIILRFLVDKQEGGISLDECAALNSKFGELFDNENLIQEPHIIEVSSPGLDRPLTTLADFRRVIGKELRFFLKSPINNKIEWIAKVAAVDENNISVINEGQEMQIPIEAITRAKHIIRG